MIILNKIGAVEIDAVIKSKLEIKVKKTNFVVERGVEVTDHTIPEPSVITINGAVSNVVLTDGTVSDSKRADAMFDLVSQIIERNASSVYYDGTTFHNMVPVQLERTSDPQNQNVLFVECVLSELRTIDRLINDEDIVSRVNVDADDAAALSSKVSVGYKTTIGITEEDKGFFESAYDFFFG